MIVHEIYEKIIPEIEKKWRRDCQTGQDFQNWQP